MAHAVGLIYIPTLPVKRCREIEDNFLKFVYIIASTIYVHQVSEDKAIEIYVLGYFHAQMTRALND